jgi:hypothetical protein
VFLIGFCMLGFFGLIACWWLMALAYVFPVLGIAGATGRDLTFAGAWRLANAALIPGALLVCLTILLYGMHRVSFASLLLAWVLHLPVGWVYAGIAPFRLPRAAAAHPPSEPNPFRPGRSSARAGKRTANPFTGRRGGTP